MSERFLEKRHKLKTHRASFVSKKLKITINRVNEWKILRFTLRYKIRSKVSNMAPKGVSMLRATKAILFGSKALEHKKWSWVCKSIGLFSPNVSKLISLKTVSKPTNHNTRLSLKGRFRLEFLTFVICQTEQAPLWLPTHCHH